MLIGIIGSGNIGGTLAGLLLRAGHEVVLANSRGPSTLSELIGRLGPGARAGMAADAAAQGQMVVVSTPLTALDALPVEQLANKIVLDTNNYYPGRDGQLAQLDDGSTTSSEMLAARLPGARVVKAFNTIWFEHLKVQGRPNGGPWRRALPLAGDDAEAKEQVGRLLDEIGYDVVDAGALSGGRAFQPGTPAYDTPLSADELRAALASR